MDRESSSPHPFQSSIDRLSQQGDVIFQSELIGVILTNKQKILWANSYIEKVLGKNHAELGKSSINGLFVSRQEYLQIAKSALDEINRENVYRVTIRLKDKNNHPIWLNASGRLLDEHSQEVVWVMVNITPQKIAEARLIEAVRVAEETNRAKSQLLATVSHEIRTPMTAIIGLSKLGMQQQDSENLSKYLKKIHDSSESLIRTLDQSLDLTKIENGKLDIESRPFQIDAVLADLQGLFKGASETKGLLFDCTLDSADPIVLNGDMHRIRQVLINLIGNAIKFTSKGKVKLSVICQKIDRNHAGINFIVADTGIGIKESEIKELIKPYNQANISIARIYGGSGLGLLICNQILALMNSQLEIKSVPNLGSTFSFTLKLPYLNKPEGLAEKELITSPESIESQLVNMPILVVEDNLVVQEMIGEFLTLSGAKVDIASNGLEALQLLSKKTYAAVLMDTQMPVMDGLTTAIQIRQLEHLKHLPIIGLSGGINPKDREACLASGMNEFVAKNTDTANLVKVLSNLISQNKSVSGIQSNQKINAVEIDYSQALPGFNPKVIETLKQNKVFERIASLFYQQTSEVMNEIDQIIHQNDIDALQQKIHYFKSSAAAIGADDLFKKTVDFDDAIGSIDSSIPLGKQLGEENIPYKEFKSALLNVRQLMGSI